MAPNPKPETLKKAKAVETVKLSSPQIGALKGKPVPAPTRKARLSKSNRALLKAMEILRPLGEVEPWPINKDNLYGPEEGNR